MALPIIIPRLGWNVEEGIFLGWLVKDGDPVRAGESLFRLEGEKAAQDIECHDSGTLRIVRGALREGDTVAVGAVIAYLLQAGETEIPAGEIARPATAPATPTRPAVAEARGNVLQRPSVNASPRARRVASELGIDWTKLRGSGRSGRIRATDVRSAFELLARPEAGKIVPLSALRRRGAERLVKSRQNTVPVTLTTTCDVTNLIEFRHQFKQREPIPSITDLFVKISALALLQHPLLAARWAEDHLVLPEEINIGIAVDTDAGLLVPVVRQPAGLHLFELASQTRSLIDRARAGKLSINDLQGGVFTITNLGMFGIDAFTPVINYPECAILGVGRIRRLPVYVDDNVVPRDQVTLSLTFDHRVVDGVPAARFLQTLTQMIESPRELLDA